MAGWRAEFLPRYIPGNPMIVPQNMPGGGSFVAAKFMSEAAPKDGTVFGSLAQTLALDSMTNTPPRSTSPNSTISAAWSPTSTPA